MLRAIKGDQFDSRGIIEDINGLIQEMINAAWIGHKTYPLAYQPSELAVSEHLDSGLHDWL